MKKLLFILPLLYYSCTDDIVSDIDSILTENEQQDAQIDSLITVLAEQQAYIDSLNTDQQTYIDSLIENGAKITIKEITIMNFTNHSSNTSYFDIAMDEITNNVINSGGVEVEWDGNTGGNPVYSALPLAFGVDINDDDIMNVDGLITLDYAYTLNKIGIGVNYSNDVGSSLMEDLSELFTGSYKITIIEKY